MAKDFYETLGVSKTASDQDIKRAYRKLAHEYHPDKSGGNADKFKEINQAYEVLSDTQKRKQYDQYGTTFEQGAPSGGGGGYQQWSDFSQSYQGGGGPFSGFENLGDIFEQFFGGGVGGQSTQQRAPKESIRQSTAAETLKKRSK